jgi:hypothetical protein
MAKISLTRYLEYCEPFFRFMVFNSTFNNISVISWQFYWLEETRIPVENDRPVASLLETLSHIVVSSTPQVEKQNTTKIW